MKPQVIAARGVRAEVSETRDGVLVHIYERRATTGAAVEVWALAQTFTVDAPLRWVRDRVHDSLHAGGEKHE